LKRCDRALPDEGAMPLFTSLIPNLGNQILINIVQACKRNPIRLLLFEMLLRRVEIEEQDFRKEQTKLQKINFSKLDDE